MPSVPTDSGDSSDSSDGGSGSGGNQSGNYSQRVAFFIAILLALTAAVFM